MGFLVGCGFFPIVIYTLKKKKKMYIRGKLIDCILWDIKTEIFSVFFNDQLE